jgi:hypothetical protein
MIEAVWYCKILCSMFAVFILWLSAHIYTFVRSKTSGFRLTTTQFLQFMSVLRGVSGITEGKTRVRLQG